MLALAVSARADENCVPTWQWVGQLTGVVNSIQAFDDGTGTALWAVGRDMRWPGGGPTNLARWTGEAWVDAHANVVQDILAFRLTAADVGDGERLFAGLAGNVHRWDGVAWVQEPVSVGDNIVGALNVLTFNGQAALYASGRTWLYRWTGSGAPQQIARLNTNQYLPNALTVFDDGAGERLYLGGSFAAISSVPMKAVARWDGATWEQVGNITNDSRPARVYDVIVFDDGSGPALYAAGNFQITGPSGPPRAIARWRGAGWEPLSGVPEQVGWFETLAVFDDGSGRKLYAGGAAGLGPDGVRPNVMVWDGASWRVVAGGVGRGPSGTGDVFDLAVFDDGAGPRLYAAGDFGNFATVPRALARLRCFCGDANGDGQVDQADLDIALAAFGVSAAGDVNEDGVTNQDDLDLILFTFGGPCVAR